MTVPSDAHGYIPLLPTMPHRRSDLQHLVAAPRADVALTGALRRLRNFLSSAEPASIVVLTIFPSRQVGDVSLCVVATGDVGLRARVRHMHRQLGGHAICRLAVATQHLIAVACSRGVTCLARLRNDSRLLARRLRRDSCRRGCDETSGNGRSQDERCQRMSFALHEHASSDERQVRDRWRWQVPRRIPQCGGSAPAFRARLNAIGA